MRILFLSNLYPPNCVGGYERLCFEVASAFAARGHEVAVLTSDYGTESAEYPGQEIHRVWKLIVGSRGIYEPFDGTAAERQALAGHNVRCFEDVVAEFAPDALFVWNLFFFDATLLQSVARQTIPTTFLLTDNWLIASLNGAFWQRYFVNHVLTGAGWSLRRLRLTIGALFSDRQQPKHDFTSRAIFASRYMQELYQKAGFGFAHSVVIHHGITDGAAIPAVRRGRLGVPGRVRLLLAGRVVEIKGVHTAVDALPRIIDALREHRVRLTIVGDARDETYLQRLRHRIAELGMEEHLTFQPPVSAAELPALFGAHDVLVFPSLYEPFSLTLIHALRAGIPTVASDAGGNPEIVAEGRTGRLFRAGDSRDLARKVIDLVRDDRQRAAIAEGGRRIAANYKFDDMVDRLETYLEART